MVMGTYDCNVIEMNEKEVKSLMKKYLNGTISEREERLLEQFDANLLSRNLKSVFKTENQKKRMGEKISKNITPRHKVAAHRNWIRLVASVILVIGLGYLYYYKQSNNLIQQQPIVHITKTTGGGEKLSLTLADGTKVKLNSGSTITFPESFAGNTREVTLVGEAFFDVTKNAQKPFIVKSRDLSTTVLGTSFNVNAYKDHQKVSVTVVTGKVGIRGKKGEAFLNPNEQGMFNRDQESISKTEVNVANFIQWKDGIIYFDDITLKEAMRKLERWYGVTFVFENEKSGECHISGTYDNEALSAVLESIIYVKKGLQYEYLENHKILIKGNCSDTD